MWYFQSSCPELFVCTAILCWDSNFLHYYFFNITNCTPSPLDLNTNFRLIFGNKNYSQTILKQSMKGFSCSNCTQRNFIEDNLNTTNQCFKRTTRIELRNYCQYSFRQKNTCQCSPADRPIQPIHDWVKSLVKPGKSHMNVVRVKSINKSASTSAYLLVSSVLLLILLGGMAGMIFYWIQLKSSQLRTLK